MASMLICRTVRTLVSLSLASGCFCYTGPSDAERASAGAGQTAHRPAGCDVKWDRAQGGSDRAASSELGIETAEPESGENPAGTSGRRCSSGVRRGGPDMEMHVSEAANVHPLRGAVLGESSAQPRSLPLRPHRLSDGSASFSLPEGWQCRELGRGQVWCVDPATKASFGVATAAVLSPSLGVRVPGTPTSRYLAPVDALPFLARAQGLAENFRTWSTSNGCGPLGTEPESELYRVWVGAGSVAASRGAA